MRVLSLALCVFAGCGAEAPCDDPVNPPTYAGEIAPLLARSCLPCHAASVRGANRQGAPLTVNYDTREEVLTQAAGIIERAASASAPMPPRSSGLPRLSSSESLRLRQWKNCGGP